MDRNIVPGWHHPACLALRGIPGRCHVGVRAEHDDERGRALGRGAPLRVGRGYVADRPPERTGFGQEKQREVAGIQPVRSRGDEGGEASVPQRLVEDLDAGSAKWEGTYMAPM